MTSQSPAQDMGEINILEYIGHLLYYLFIYYIVLLSSSNQPESYKSIFVSLYSKIFPKGLDTKTK